MKNLPIDIDKKIDQLFDSNEERQTARGLINSLWNKNFNVGPDQLARSILVISGNQLSKLEEIFDSNFYNDPRDVIMEAEAMMGHPKNYFIKPLSD